MGASRYLDLVNEKVVVYDGAFGTYVQTLGLGPDDFGGEHFEGCNELLVVTRPDVIATMHDEFFKVGVDVVETATLRLLRRAARRVRHRASDRTRSTSPRPASPARWPTATGASSPARSGPGTKFASLGQIRFAELRDAYEEQAAGLLEGGVDLLLVETQFDLLGAKAGDDRLPPGDGRRGPRGADPGAGHHGAHRHHAPGHRDRCRPGRPRRHAPRRHRDQLRHRARPR